MSHTKEWNSGLHENPKQLLFSITEFFHRTKFPVDHHNLQMCSNHMLKLVVKWVMAFCDDL